MEFHGGSLAFIPQGSVLHYRLTDVQSRKPAHRWRLGPNAFTLDRQQGSTLGTDSIPRLIPPPDLGNAIPLAPFQASFENDIVIETGCAELWLST